MKTRYPGIYSRQLKDGTTVYDVVATVAGKQRWSRGHKTIPLARDALDLLRNDLRKHLPSPASPRMTLAEYLLERWLPYIEGRTTSDETLRAYRRQARQLVAAVEAIVKRDKRSEPQYRLKALTPLNVESIKTELSRHLLPAAAAQAYARLAQAMNDAVKWELIDRSPCERISRIPEPKRDAPFLPMQLLTRILEEADKTAYGTLVYLTMVTGLRWGEVTGLLWSDVDFAGSQLRVRRAETKTRKGARVVWLGPETLRRLQEYRFEQMKRFADLDAAPRKLVFTSPMGMDLNHRHFHSSVWNPIRKAAGAPDLHFHDLRHAQATLLARAGVHPRIAQERLGHARFETTMSIYTNVSASDQEAGAAAVEALLRPEDG